MKQDRKWILTIELIAKPAVTKKDLQDKGMLQDAFNSHAVGGSNIEIVQASAMLQQPVKE